LNRSKLILAACGVLLAFAALAFSVARSSAEPEMPKVEAGERPRTEDAPELGVPSEASPHQVVPDHL